MLTSLPSTAESLTVDTRELEASLASIDPADWVHHNKFDCVKAASIIRKGRQPKTSAIWKYDNGSEWIQIQDRKKYWRCDKRKKPVFLQSSTTSHAFKHLQSVHQISSNGLPNEASGNVLQQQLAVPRSTAPGLIARIDKDRFKAALIEWIVYLHLAFSMATNVYFRTFLEVCSVTALGLLPDSENTIRAWIMDAFHTKKQQLMNKMHKTKGLIHISLDLWTSPNSLALVGVAGHQFDGQSVKVTLLGLRRVKGSHSDENIAEQVVAVIRDYKIESRLGYFVLDNADTNDICVAAVLETI